MDFEQARFNMIEQQIRPWEVLDSRVLDLLNHVHREDFVPPQYRELAFVDMNIPLGEGEVMMQPKIEARLLQELSPQSTDIVLEIGTGSGYLTALLATMGKYVYTVEIRPQFHESVGERLAAKGFENVTLELGDGARSWDKHKPYDAIILTGSVPIMPNSFRESLAPGGRLVAIVGQPPIMEALVTRRVHETGWQTTSLFDTSLPPLINAETPPAFVF